MAVPVYGQSITAASDGTQTDVNQAGDVYTITGGTSAGNNLFHSFTDFNLLGGESATFFTDPGTLNILGRITGGNPSLINGLLSVSGSNANLFLLNPAGILFGANAALNLGGSFTATTADGVTFGTGDFGAIGSNDYGALVGDPTGFIFSRDTPGSIVNGGTLAVTPGETLQLIGGQVINTGTLEAPGGAIVIAAVEGESLVRIAQDGLVLNLELATLPNPSGTPLPFTPLALPELLTGSGLSDAVGVLVNADGTVNLTGSNLPIPTQPGIAVASGDLLAAGGQVDILGSTVAVINALVDVSGEFGGGQIRVGGDYLGSGPVPNALVTYVDGNSVLNADATVDGDGGRIILWSDQTTRTYGNLSARGGLLGGDGGFIETSSAGYLDISGAPDVGAPNGNGGSWLIDPLNITIGVGAPTVDIGVSGGPPIDTLTASDIDANPLTDSFLNVIDLQNFFLTSGGQLTISTGATGAQAGNITISENLTFGASGSLTLIAAGDVTLTHDISSAVAPLDINVTAGGNIIFDNTATPATPFTIATGGGNLNFTGSEVVIGGTGAATRAIDSGTGNITLTATGGTGAGVRVDTSGALRTTTGTIALNGTGGTNGVEVAGIITAAGGTVNLNGTGGTGFGVDVQAGSTLGGGVTNLGIQGISSAGTSINSAIGLTTLGGNLSLTGNQDIVATTLNALGTTGGVIDVTTSSFFRASGPITTNSGSAITIRHGGGGITPFIVGDDTTNGTGGAIANGVDTIATIQSFLYTYTQGNISIISVPDPATIAVGGSSGGNSDCTTIPSSFCDKLPGSSELPDPLDPTEILTAEPEVVTDYALTALDIEASLTEDFVDHFGFDTPTLTSPAAIQQNLKEITDATGAKPGVLYVYFAPQAVETVAPQVSQQTSQLPPDQTKSLGADAVLWSATHDGLTIEALPWQQASRPDNVPLRDSDPLELILITPEAPPVRLRLPEVQRDQFMAKARTFRNEVADPSKIRTTSYLPSSQQLYDWILRPLERELAAQNINNLSFILDAGLRGMPLAAIHDGNGFIIERFSIGLMPSFSLTDTRYRDIRDVMLLAAGAAEFQEQPPLPAVPLELNTIVGSLWPGTLLLNETFTPENVKAERQQRPFGIIHLATHGEFRPGAASNSYIQFWQEQVQLDDIRDLGWADPTVELVVLSACRLALGDNQAELGFAGMAVQSGTKSVLASLWNVDDTGTMGLMLEFYQQLQSAPIKAEAIRQAQLQMLNQRVTLNQGTVIWTGGEVDLPAEFGSSTRRFDHPYFWSAFTLVGNPW
ncbi:MAG: CHAT domain-containing protein [Cyanobacteria bacterium]|nr:CHAT domain-containing protein [Cyanobacteriota bacterium]